MKYLAAPLAAFFMIFLPLASASESTNSNGAEYLRLFKATRIIESFQQMAVVSARVFAARNQGSDAEFARFMGVVAKADLSDIDGCIVELFERSGLAPVEAEVLISMFESPLGAKLLDESNRVMRATLEDGAPVKPSFEAFSPDERQRMGEIYATPAFRKYGVMVTSKEWAAGMMLCVTKSKAVRSANFQF